MYLVTSQQSKKMKRKRKYAIKVTVESTWCHNVGHPNKVSGWIASSCPGRFLPGMDQECRERWLFLHRPARLYEFSTKMADWVRGGEKGGEGAISQGLFCVHVRDIQDNTKSSCLADTLGSSSKQMSRLLHTMAKIMWKIWLSLWRFIISPADQQRLFQH